MNDYTRLSSSILLVVILLVVSSNSEESVDIVFIVDGSSDRNALLFRKELLLIPETVSRLSYNHEDIKFGLITYSKHATIQLALGYLENNKALLHKLWHIKNVQSRSPSLSHSLKIARLHMFKTYSNRNRFVIIFANTPWNAQDTTNEEAIVLKRMGVKILMIMVGDYINKRIALSLVDSKNIIFKPRINLNFIQKTYIFNFILNNIYQQKSSLSPHLTDPQITTKPFTTLLSKNLVTSNKPLTMSISTQTSQTLFSKICESNSSITQAIRLESSAKPNVLPLSTTVQSTDTENVLSIPKECYLYRYVVYAIDASSSVSNKNFIRLLNLTKAITKAISKKYARILFGIVTYGSETIVNIGFDDYTSQEDLWRKIDSIKQQGGESDLGSCLSVINSKVYVKVRHYKIGDLVIFSTDQHPIGPDPIIISNIIKLSKSIKISVIRIGNNTNKWIDDTLSTQGSYYVEDVEHLRNSGNNIIKAICRVY